MGYRHNTFIHPIESSSYSIKLLLRFQSLPIPKIPANRYHRHAVTWVWAVLDINKCGYQTATKHRQQHLVVPEFVKAAIGIKIMAVFVLNIIQPPRGCRGSQHTMMHPHHRLIILADNIWKAWLIQPQKRNNRRGTKLPKIQARLFLRPVIHDAHRHILVGYLPIEVGDQVGGLNLPPRLVLRFIGEPDGLLKCHIATGVAYVPDNKSAGLGCVSFPGILVRTCPNNKTSFIVRYPSRQIAMDDTVNRRNVFIGAAVIAIRRNHLMPIGQWRTRQIVLAGKFLIFDAPINTTPKHDPQLKHVLGGCVIHSPPS